MSRLPVPSFNVSIAAAIGNCTPISMGSSAIARLYPPSTSLLTSVAVYSSATLEGTYSPCYEVDPTATTTRIPVVVPITVPGNVALPPSVFDCLYIKLLGTFSSGSATETIPATRKS
jgi:hypothetical protein